MRRVIMIILGSLLVGLSLDAQEAAVRFRLQLSGDSVLMGNTIIARFTLENAEGQNFQPPLFEGFDIYSGPNQSSSMSIINGERSQSLSYTYYLRPRDIGNYYIEPAAIEADNRVLETEPMMVMVLPNPDGIMEEPQSLDMPFHFRFDGGGVQEFNSSDLFERFRGLDGFDLFEGLDSLDMQRLMPQMPQDSIQGPKKKKRKTYKL